MHSPVPDYLAEVVASLADDADGEVAAGVPALAAADPELLGVALTMVDGRTHTAGDDAEAFSIQSISKPFAYAAALVDVGFDVVHDVVGVEPSGEAFDELSLEGGSRRPRNPMINAGAIAVHHLLVGPDADVPARVERARSFFSELAGRELEIDADVHRSEMAHAERHLAIAHLLRSHGIVDAPAHDVVDGYVQQCSVSVTVQDLAMMGATLANAGVHPRTGRRVVDAAIARQTLSVMASCGMYDKAGQWLAEVGIPAKSGVSGGLLGALPGQCGIAVLSPRLDDSGTSVRGVRAFRRMSADLDMHLADALPYGSTVVRDVAEVDGRTVLELQGTVRFSGGEAVVEALAADDSGRDVVVDVARVDRFSDVARRLVLEGMRRLREDGRAVGLHDPDGALPDPDLGDGTRPDDVPEAPRP